MSALAIGILGVGALIGLVAVGTHVAFAAALVGFFGIVAVIGVWPAVGIVGAIPYSELSFYTYSVLPMFVLIGLLAYHANITQGLFRCMNAWFGWLPGGLAIATVFAAAAFGAISGASTATAAVFSRVAIPEMLRYNYAPSFAAGVVAAGGTLASLIPPSGILVIYAIIVEESVGALLIAGVVPGVLSALIYAGSIALRAKLDPALAGGAAPKAGWGERIRSLAEIWGVAATVGIVIGGIYSGYMTPTESGAVGAAVIFGFALMRGLRLRELRSALMEAAKTSVMILTMIWGVLILVRFFGFANLPAALQEIILGLDVDRFWILMAILLMYVILGMFMDAIGMFLLTLPLIYPIVIGLGYDPVWFGIIAVKMVEICLITPPIGLNCFVVAGVRPDIPLTKIFRGIWWFFVCDVLTLALLIAYPEIVLWLPERMMG
jgi:tripartite ATP-independent transporter DctM subunit